MARKRTKKARKKVTRKEAPQKSEITLYRESFAERYKEEIQELLPSEITWVIAFLTETNFNGQKAAIIAGYSPRTAAQAAHRIRYLPRVRNLINKYMAEIGSWGEDYLIKLKNIVDEDIATPLFEFLTGNKTLAELKEDGFDMSIIKGIQMFTDKDGHITSWKIDTLDKDRALAILGKAYGIFDDSMKVTNVTEDNRITIVTQVPSVCDRRALPPPDDVIDVVSEVVSDVKILEVKEEPDESWLEK